MSASQMIRRLRKHAPVILGLLAILALYSWACADDMRAEQNSAAYTQEIMEAAKQDALAKAYFNRLREWGDQFVPQQVAMGEVR